MRAQRVLRLISRVFVAVVMVVAGVTLVGPTPTASAAPEFVNRTTTDGLGNNTVNGVFASGSTVYAATGGGLSISTNGGTSFVNRSTGDGLGTFFVNGVFASGSTVYAATSGGLSISTDSGVTFVNRTTGDGLGNNFVVGVFASGSTVYAATTGGVSISTNGGTSFVNRTTTDGLGNNNVRRVFVDGSTVYAATSNGLSISTDSGENFANRTTTDGLGSNSVFGVFVDGSTVYAATTNGLSISTNGGTSFANRMTADGLGSNNVRRVFVDGSTVYAATSGGLSISTNGGTSFVNRTTTDGLGNNSVNGVFVDGSTVYAATDGGLSIGAAPATVPGAPTGVVGTPASAQVSVSWSAPASDGGAAVTGYTVTSDPEGKTCTTDGALSCVVTGLTNGTSYTFTVVATNAAGNSAASDSSAAVTPATVPGAPTGVSVTPGNTQVLISWTAPGDGGSAITGYTVTSIPGSGCSVGGETTSCLLSGLTNGTAYTFTVVATNAAGDSTPSEPVTASPRTVPEAPTGVSGTPGNAEVEVSWTAPVSTGGSAITGYTVTSDPEGKTCTTDGATTCVVTGLGSGIAYTFTVVATNAAGDSTPSEPSAAVTTPTTTTTTTTSTTVAPTTTVAPGPSPVVLQLTLDFAVGDNVRAGTTLVTGSGRGLAAFADVLLVLRSDPEVIGAAVTDASGDAEVVGTIPGDTPAGRHSVTLESVAPDGSVVTDTAFFWLDANGTVTAVTSEGPTVPAGSAPRFTG